MNKAKEPNLSELLRKKRRLWKYHLTFLSIMLFLSFIVSVCIGILGISYMEITYTLLKNLLSPFLHGNYFSIEQSKEFVVVNLRFPRAFMSMLVGASLATAGCVFQAIFKNPLADPYVVGVSSGAALGAAVAIVLGLNVALPGVSGITSTAFTSSLIVMLAVYYIASAGGRLSSTTLLLTGVIISIFLSALLAILMVFSGKDLHVLIFWLMGGFSHIRWPYILTSTPIIIPTLILVILFSRDLNLLLLSEEEAQHLGLDVFRTIKIFLILGSLVTAAAVSCSGCIGFIGLVVPHIMRILVGPDHRILLPSSILVGASLLTFCDILARVAFPPIELPVGVITALVGAPLFLYLIYRRRKGYSF